MPRGDALHRGGLRLQFLQLIWKGSRAVAPAYRIQAATDPDDNIFLECADAARVDFLITGTPDTQAVVTRVTARARRRG